MADNINVTPGSGATIAADEVTIDGATALVQRVKPVHGVAGSAVDTSEDDPLPVLDAAAVAQLTLILAKLADPATEGTLADLLTAAQDTSTLNMAQDTAIMKNGATSLTPKFAAISSTDDGDTVALVSGKKIRVLSMYFVVAGATTVKFQSGASTDKTGAMSFAANGGISLPFNPVGWFETASGEKLNHVLSNAVAIAGGLTYIEV